MASTVTVRPCFVRLVRLKTINSSQVKTNSNSIAVSPIKSTRKVVRCPVCQKQFQRKWDMKTHIRVHTGERPFACTICKQKFKTQHCLTRHSSTVHNDSRPFSCLWCEKSFKQSSILMAHLRMHTREKPYFCKECPLSFATLTSLIQHALNKHNSGEAKNKKCECCGKSFYTTTNLRRHQKIHTGEKPYSCLVCGKSFARKDSFVNHSRVHSKSLPFKCTECSKAYRFKKSLLYHTLSVHEKLRPFPCEICGRTFFTKQSRDNHINSHLNEKHFLCPKCPKRFSCKKNVMYHLKAYHENRRDFKCSKCPRSFVDKSHLDGHFLQSHSKQSEKPLTCLFCSKKYCKPNEFENHLRSHLAEKPYFCQICHFSSGMNGNLKQHVRSVHKSCID